MMDSSTESKVIFTNVGKTFHKRGKELPVLEGIDLKVKPGEFVCLLGPSGCGKSTLLNIAGGFESPTRGSVTNRWQGGNRAQRQACLCLSGVRNIPMGIRLG